MSGLGVQSVEGKQGVDQGEVDKHEGAARWVISLDLPTTSR